MKIATVLVCICVLFYRPISTLGAGGPLDLLVRAVILGYPEVYQKHTLIFDPDIALRRRIKFVEEHGDKGVRLVEKLGLGIDGNEEEILEKQRMRDEGHLGELNAYLP